MTTHIHCRMLIHILCLQFLEDPSGTLGQVVLINGIDRVVLGAVDWLLLREHQHLLWCLTVALSLVEYVFFLLLKRRTLLELDFKHFVIIVSRLLPRWHRSLVQGRRRA
jgi:hypothetical protein